MYSAVGAAFVLFVAVILGFVYVHAMLAAKKEVNAAPRIPMFECPEHGVFPAKSTIRLTMPAEGMEPFVQEICPFCYDTKMRAAEHIFKV